MTSRSQPVLTEDGHTETGGSGASRTFVCPRCGTDCRPNGDPHLGTCAGPPTPAAPPPHRMQG